MSKKEIRSTRSVIGAEVRAKFVTPDLRWRHCGAEIVRRIFDGAKAETCCDDDCKANL